MCTTIFIYAFVSHIKRPPTNTAEMKILLLLLIKKKWRQEKYETSFMVHVFSFICIPFDKNCVGDFQWATLEHICYLVASFVPLPMVFMRFGVAKIAMWLRPKFVQFSFSLLEHACDFSFSNLHWLLLKNYWTLSDQSDHHSSDIFVETLQIISFPLSSSSSLSSWITFVLICCSSAYI